MSDVKNIFSGGLDLDTSYTKVRKDSYVDALNITRDAISGNEDDVISNLVGNRLFDYISKPTGTNKFIGGVANTLRNTIITCFYNSESHHYILEYDLTTRQVVRVFESLLDSDTDILGFTINGKVTGMNIYNRDEGDLLFFLDTLGRPTYMDLDLFKAQTYNPVTRDIIDVCLRPPLSPITSAYGNDTTKVANNFFKKLVRFRYRWIFDDFGKSCYSTISAVPLQVNVLNPAYTNITTNNNVVNLTLNSGPKNVKGIELCVSISENSNQFGRFQKVLVIEKATLLLDSNSSFSVNGTTTTAIITFAGYVTAGTVINIYLILLPSTQTLVGTYTVLAGDNILTIVLGLIASIGGIGIATAPTFYSSTGLSFQFDNTLYSFDETQIIPLDTNVDNIDFTYPFYNDGTYPFIADNESLLLYDFVPDFALSREFPNGNVDSYGAITEGYDKDLEPNVLVSVNTVAAGSSGSVGTLSAVPSFPGGSIVIGTFSGVPATGTVVNIRIRDIGTGIVSTYGTYTTLSGDTAVVIPAALRLSILALNAGPPPHLINFVGYSGTTLIIGISPGYEFVEFEIISPATSTANNSVATWKWSTERSIGIVYFSLQGKTNGVLYNAKISFPAYAENGSHIPLIPYLNVKIYHVPPIWAHSYQIVFTKEPTQYLFFECIDVNTTESSFLYFDITNLAINQAKNPTTAEVISWTFQEGDKMRLIRRMADGNVFGSTYDTYVEGIVTAPTINNVVQTGKTFIKIKRLSPFSSETYASKFFVIELYRPGQQPPTATNEAYYECGVQYAVLNPETVTRVHAGQVTNQSTDYITPAEINIYQGDSYFRSRTVTVSETGFGIFNVQDRNFVDFYISSVSSIDGRVLAIEENARTATYGATIRFSEAYQPYTNINGLHRFYPNNLQDCDYSGGNIVRMSTSVDRKILKIFQTNRTARIFIYSQINRQPDGVAVQVVTDKLLNPPDYYVGNFGIGTAATGLSAHNFAHYFFDNIRGAIIRVSNDGMDVISLLYNTNSWAVSELPIRNGTYFGYGAFDQKLNNYIIALERALLADVVTVAHELRFGIPIKYVFALSNNPHTGDIITTTLTDGNGTVKIYSYTALATDTQATMVVALKAIINADVFFVAANQVSFPESGLFVSQVTPNNPSLFTGSTTIKYGDASYSLAQTLVFAEGESDKKPSFDSFSSLMPEGMVTIGTLLCSFKNGQMWTHDSTVYNNFFGVQYDSIIDFVFNDIVSADKTFEGMDQRGNTKWDCPEIITSVNSYGTTPQRSTLVDAEFQLFEGKYSSSFKRDINSRGGKINGDFLKGNWIKVRMRKQNASSLTTLNIVDVYYVESNLNKK